MMIGNKVHKSSVSTVSVTDQVKGVLKKIILNGELKPGDRLNEVQVSEALGISRSPVREAIQSLANEGLVVLIPRKGALIRKLTAKEIEDLFEVRVALETKAAFLAAQRASESQLKKLSSLLDRTESALKNKNYSKYPLDFDFHLQIASLAQNIFLEEKIQEINAKLLLVRHRSGEEMRRSWEAFKEHKEVFECVKMGDSRSAFVSIRKHLRKARMAILKMLAEEDD